MSLYDYRYLILSDAHNQVLGKTNDRDEAEALCNRFPNSYIWDEWYRCRG